MGFDIGDCIVCYVTGGYNDYARDIDSSDTDDGLKTVCAECIEKMFRENRDSYHHRVNMVLSKQLNECPDEDYCVLCNEEKNLTFDVSCCKEHFGMMKKKKN